MHTYAHMCRNAHKCTHLCKPLPQLGTLRLGELKLPSICSDLQAEEEEEQLISGASQPRLAWMKRGGMALIM